MKLVSVFDVISYLGVGTRPLIEGEAVLNAGHVIKCGINKKNVNEVLASCVQTSKVNGPPHNIKILLSGKYTQICES